VIGSQQSSNSQRLAETGRACGRPSHLIEDETEIDTAWLNDLLAVGVTAGASTPESTVVAVLQRLRGLGFLELIELTQTTERVRFPTPSVTSF
jgi:4-hydroxy-3-methylbut-2-en-1-yl diphosphate reductase